MTNEVKAMRASMKRNAAAEKMRAAGFYPASEVAERMQVHLGSVYRWIAEGEVQATKIAGRSFISRSSLIAKIGSDAARVFGFVGPAAPKLAVTPTIVVEEDEQD